MTASPSLLLTMEEVAVELRIARSRVFELAARGDFPTVKIGRSRRVLRSALEAYVRELATTSGQ